jgi:hypothetical protein
LKTAALKLAIKALKANKNTAVSIVKAVGGATVANNFSKFYSGIVSALDPLLKYADLVEQTVADAVRRGAMNAGASNAVATTIANVVKAGLDFFL